MRGLAAPPVFWLHTFRIPVPSPFNPRIAHTVGIVVIYLSPPVDAAGARSFTLFIYNPLVSLLDFRLISRLSRFVHTIRTRYYFLSHGRRWRYWPLSHPDGARFGAAHRFAEILLQWLNLNLLLLFPL
jgi:hypothetical protein